MKKNLLAAVVFLLATTAVMAQSQANKESGFYAELGIAQGYYNEPGFSFNNSLGVLKGGYNINKYIAAEVMAAGNLNTATGYYGTTYLTAKVSSAYGGFAKFSLPVNDQFSLFARVGVVNATVNATASNGSSFASVEQSGSDLSYGAGAQFNFTKDIYGQVDYMSYYRKNNVTVVAPSVSVGYKF